MKISEKRVNFKSSWSEENKKEGNKKRKYKMIGC